MLQRIYIDNYKCLANFELKLGSLALLLGPNGVGKSAIFDVLFAVRELLAGKVKVSDPQVFPTRTLTRWDTRARQVVELEVALEDDRLKYRLEIDHEREARRAKISLEHLAAQNATLFKFENGLVHLYDDRGKEGAQFAADWSESFLARVVPRRENKRLTRFLEFVRGIVICGVYPGTLSTESSSEDPILARDASNFSSWYRHLVQERPELLAEFTKALAEAIDGLRSLRLERVGEDTRALSVAFQEEERSYELKLGELSDGHRALMVLYALLRLAPGRGETLVLDEPDNYVALSEIQPWLIQLADACREGRFQAILSSHHPELIDYLGADHGLLLRREPGGPVTVRPVREALEASGNLRLSELVARGWEQ